MTRVISLGAGVQSSTMLMMVQHGEIEPVACAVFADTCAEPVAVYEYLDYLRTVSTTEIRVVSQGDLELAVLDGVRLGKRSSNPPLYMRTPDGKMSPASRKCTTDYKLAPLRREMRRIMEERGDKRAVNLIGISLDEAHRMKESPVKYLSNEYPLVDMRMKRTDCLKWMEAHGYKLPPKSACVWCPWTSRFRWLAMYRNAPRDFARAVSFDHAIRQGKLHGAKYPAFVHASGRPLDEWMADYASQGEMFTSDDFDPSFGQECEGMCGV